MRTTLAACAAGIAFACPAAFAQAIGTPVLTLTNSSAQALEFGLVSQTAWQTRIDLTGVARQVDYSFVVEPGGRDKIVALSTLQQFSLAMQPEYRLRSIELYVEGTAYASGPSISGPSASLYFKIASQGSYSDGTIFGAGHTGTGLYADYLPAQIDDFDIELTANIYLKAPPWEQSSAEVKAQSVYLVFNTEQITPVPEPETALMLLAGLAILGTFRCARRRRASCAWQAGRGEPPPPQR